MSADLSPYALDPFGPSANPRAYVACEASERARAALERSLDAGRVAAVSGPPGHGKTLLLRLLAGREEARARVAYVPFCTLEPDELFAVVLNALGAPRAGSARDALLALARRLAPRGGIVILVDDANDLPDASAAALASLYAELEGALRIALAAIAGPDAQRVFRAFGGAIDVVSLADGLSGRESRRYVETRLAYGGARPELLAAFDEQTIEALHRVSQGVPRRLNQAAQEVVLRATRSALPRLREMIGPPPQPVRARLELAPPAPEPSRPAPREPLRPVAREPVRPAAAPPPRAPLLPPRPAPPPASDADRDDGRGILLPETFERTPGEPSGEYRLVRERVGGALRARGSTPYGDALDERARGASARRPARHWPDALRAPERAQRPVRTQLRPPTARPPLRLIGVAGFTLGVAVTLYLIRETPRYDIRPPVVVAPPAAVAPAPPVRPPEPLPVLREPAPVIPEPMLSPAPPASEVERMFPSRPRTAPVPLAEPAPAPAPPLRARGSVAINATPWAVVSIDGREVGETPLAGIELEPGSHLFQARMPDGSTRQQRIEIGSGRTTVVFE